MAIKEWRIEMLLEKVSLMVRSGLPGNGLYLPAWRWELDLWLMRSIKWPLQLDDYRQILNKALQKGHSVPEIRFDELPLLDILEHGLAKPVLSDEQVIRLAFSPDTMERINRELLQVGQECGDIWEAVEFSSEDDTDLPTPTAEEQRKGYVKVLKLVEKTMMEDSSLSEEEKARTSAFLAREYRKLEEGTD